MTAPAAGSLSIIFDVPTNSTFSNYFTLDVYSSNGTKLNSYKTGADTTYTVGLAGTGTYYIAVSAVDYYYDSGQYSLRLSPPSDSTPPSITASSNRPNLTAGQTATLTFAFSESVTDFVVGDITVSGGTLSNLTGSGTSYSATFTPTANSTANGVVSVGNSKFSDAAGNFNVDGADANNTVTISVNTKISDTTLPTIAITSGSINIVSGQSSLLTFALSEPSENFSLGDILVSGGTLSNFGGSGDRYTAIFTLGANKTQIGSISVPNAAFSDSAGNFNNDGGDLDNNLIVYRNEIPQQIYIRDLGGKSVYLVNPIQIQNGDVYYLLDANGDGKNSYAPGVISSYYLDSISHDYLDKVLNSSSDTKDTQPAGAVWGVDDERTLVIDNYTLVLPSKAEWERDFAPSTRFMRDGAEYLNGTIPNGNVSSSIFSFIGWNFANYVWLSTPSAYGHYYGNTLNGTTDSNSIAGVDSFGSMFGVFRVIFKEDTQSSPVIPPTIAITTSKTSVGSGQSATLTFSLSASSIDFLVGDVVVSGGTLSNFSGSGASYYATFTPNVNSTTTAVISVGSGKFSDTAGNFNTDGADANNSVTITVNTIPLDATPPTIAIGSDRSALGGVQTATISFALSESVSDFTIGDIAVSGGLLSNFSGSGANYTATFTPSSNSVTNGLVSVGSGRFSDAAGNFNVDGGDPNNSFSFSIDTVPPTIAISADQTSLKAGQAATIVFALSESSSSFNLSKVSVSGGTLGNLFGSGLNYFATFTPVSNSTSNGVISVGSNKFSDAAGNFNVDGSDANNTVTISVNTVPADTTPPTIAITSDRSTLAFGQTAILTFATNESVSDFVVGDITVSGGALDSFAGSGTSYTARFTPPANSTSNGVISVGSSKFSDVAGNLNIDGADANNSVTIVVDTQLPNITLGTSSVRLTLGQTATMEFLISEVVSDFDASDINVSGGTLSNFGGSGRNYTATFTPTANSTANGVVSVGNGKFSDAAGNFNVDGSDLNNTITMSVNTVPADTTPPTIAITSNRSSLIAGQTAILTFAISESVSDFVLGDITFSGGTLGNFSGSGTSYSATFTPNVNSTANAAVSVASNRFSDATGNFNVDGSDANNTVTMTVNTTPASTATTPTIAWTRLIGGSGDDGSQFLATGADGSVYVGGNTTSSVIDGQSNAGSVNPYDVFVAKYSRDGNKIWTRLIGSSGNEYADAITIGNDGSIYVGGSTNGASLGGQNSAGGTDAFLRKIDADGNSIWTRLIGSTNLDAALALATGSDGSIYAAGHTQGPILDGQTGPGWVDAFLTKFTPSGDRVWTRLIGAVGREIAYALTTGLDGVLYVAGQTDSAALDGQINAGGIDGFISKFAPDGTKVWTRLIGSKGTDDAKALTTGLDGSIYVIGDTADGIIDGQINSGEEDVFLSKFAPDGSKLWTRLIGGAGSDRGHGVTTGLDGAIYVSGETWNSLGGLPTTGLTDAFVTKFSADGTQLWSKLIGGNSWDGGYSLSTGPDGSIYFSGGTSSNPFNGQAGSGGSDAFLVKLTEPDTTPPTVFVSSNRSNLSVGQTATLTFLVSEPVADFVFNDITVSGGTLSNFAGGGTSYSATFTPNTNSTSNAVIAVASNKFSDAAGNFNVDGADTNNTVTISVNTVTTATKTGTTADDSLMGSAINDAIYGLAGNDTLDGGLGADTLIGGAGNDTYYVDNAGDSIVELFGEGTDTEIASFSVYLAANVENLTLTGAAYFGVGNALDNVIVGSSAGNLLLGADGNDKITGGDARDAIFGESGNDSITGGGGVDYIVAGTGNDSIDGGTGADEIYGEDGNDSIYGGSDFATDILVGGVGNDTLDGGPAWDQMYGGTGDDTFYVSQQVDWVFENAGEGYDTVIADSPNGYYLYANIEALTLVGTTPFGVGNELNNILTGSAIGNVLLGGPGNDTLDGGAGQDILYGQAGADTFLIRKGTGIDIIADFTPGTDRIDLSDYGFKSVAAARPLFQQVGGDVSVNLGNGDTLILMGVQASSIGNADIYTGKINTAPVATAASFSLSENTQKSGTLTASDIDLDPLTFIKVSDPAHGAISLSANGSFIYTPTTNYAGSDTFSFKVNDGNVDSANAVVTFNVANVNNSPTGSVTISPAAPVDVGYAKVTNSLVDLDGIIGSIRYQWLLNGQNVAGATGADFFLAGVAGSLLSVRASYTDGGGVAESVLSQVVVVGAQPPPPSF